MNLTLVLVVVTAFVQVVYGKNQTDSTVPPDTSPPACEGDLKYLSRASSCENLCEKETSEPKVCRMEVVTECQCEPTQWRFERKCYDSKDDCPPSNKCNGDLKFITQGSGCQNLCGIEFRGPTTICTQSAIPGCQCEDAQWRLGDNCYDSKSKCPEPKCEGDLKYLTRGSTCQNICGEEMTEYSRVCLNILVTECQCDKTQWRSGNRCYDTKSECPAAPKCEGNLTFTSCGSNCQHFCDIDEPEPAFCSNECVAECQCKLGQWRMGDMCYVSKSECPVLPTPQQCEGDLKFKSCGVAHENLCEEAGLVMSYHSEVCVAGCQCKKTQWRSGNTCFNNREECPTPKCEDDLEFTLCGSSC